MGTVDTPPRKRLSRLHQMLTQLLKEGQGLYRPHRFSNVFQDPTDILKFLKLLHFFLSIDSCFHDRCPQGRGCPNVEILFVCAFVAAKHFLAAMSSSRSDIVTQFMFSFIRPLFFLLVSLEFYLVLKSFNGVSRKF